MIQNLVQTVRHNLKKKRIEGFFITNIKNVRYLTGFSGSSGFVLITESRNFFFTDFRYQEQAAKEVHGWQIEIEKGNRTRVIKNVLKKEGIKRLGFETSVSYDFYEHLRKLPVVLVAQKGLIENLRRIKSEEEILNIRKAIERAERAFLKIKPWIKVGLREREIAIRLEIQLKKEGCRNVPFDIIVASGKNSSMPHARPTEKRIEKGDFVIIDWGGEANGYYSDMTRTLLTNGASISKKVKIYNIVNRAGNKAISAIKKGVKTEHIDRVARNTIKAAGYAEFFGHGTGHGIGLDVHERPHITWSKGESIKDGMVFTIEPGIYIPELGGVRIEDMVLVRDGKADVLTTLNRELEIIT